MTSRPTIASAALVLVVGAVLAGCTAAAPPTPRPTLTPLSPEQEAFAAAEATYRAYITALNGRREDPMSATDPNEYLAGDALRESSESLERLADNELHLEGETRLLSADPLRASSEVVVMQVCIDSTDVRLIDRNGEDVTPRDRSDVGPLEVHVSLATDTPRVIRSLESDLEC